MNQSAKISIIMVNYNSASLTLACIESLRRQTITSLEIIVADNDSPEGDRNILAPAANDHGFRFIDTGSNLGFGRANNLAVAQSSGEYLLLLNPDTLLNDADTLEKLLAHLDANPAIGVVSPALNIARRQRIQRGRKTYPEHKHLKHTDFSALPGPYAWVRGACMLMKREVYERIGGFDPDYFMYGEDIQLCLDIRRAGWGIDSRDDILIDHISGASEAKTATREKWLRKRRGKFLFITKSYDPRDSRAILKHLSREARIKLLWARTIGLLTGSAKDAPMYEATIEAAAEAIQRLAS